LINKQFSIKYYLENCVSSSVLKKLYIILKSNRIMEIFHKKLYTKNLLTKDML